MSSSVLIAVAILLMWLGSMFLPVADTVNPTGSDTATGFTVLAMGWLGPLIGQFGWYANLLLPASLVATVKWPSHTGTFTIVAGLILAALAINTMFWSNIPMDNGENHIVRYRLGYWLWMASVITGSAWLLSRALIRGGGVQA